MSVDSNSFSNEPILSRPRPRRVSIGNNPGPFNNTNYGSLVEQKDSRNSLREHTAGLSAMAMEEGMHSYQSSTIDLDRDVSFATGNLSQVVDDEIDESSDIRYEQEQLLPVSSGGGDEEGFNQEQEREEEEEIDVEGSPLLGSRIADHNISDPDTMTAENSYNSLSSSSSRFQYQSIDRPDDIENQACLRRRKKKPILHKARKWCNRNITKENVKNQCITVPIKSLPSILLGVLLNILDGLSYGILLFDTSRSVFSGLGPAGLSMFYVSCIVSQLVYSLGGSVFKAGVGGEMIEVVPFFHTMASVILAEVGEENPKSVVATTVVSYALSSVVTGLVFFALGYARLGSLIGFFPRHILVGCVGGVGWFLVVTGIEVSGQQGPLEYNWHMLKLLTTHPDILMKWAAPLGVALILMGIQRFNHHALILPAYFITVFIVFHFVIWIVPSLSLEYMREVGWVFSPPEVSAPWYSFYELYDFTEVNLWALVRTVPAMFALTFFGILHVPINVPALAASIEEDNIDVDRELIAHGVSNALSGLVGSVQNYLVYTNSLLFIKSGAESRVSGVLLAVATFCVMVAGPVLIGFIPILVVGALIFLLGIELMQEALLDTYGRVSRFEYFTIAVIVVTMGAWDFVYGILVGIMLACVSFVIQASRISAIKASYTGKVARSTVRRHAVQRKFLEQVGDQIYVMKLSGSMFFGTIVNVERTVRNLIDEVRFSNQPIRYLVIDVSAVTNIDYSASEGFARVNRLLKRKGVFMLLCGATEDVSVMQGLKAVKLLGNRSENQSVMLFDNLNMALEWCENEFLSHYYKHRERCHSASNSRSVHDIPKSRMLRLPEGEIRYGASPRATGLQRAAENTVQEDIQVTSKWQNFKQPLPIMMQIFQGLSLKNEDFWHKVAPYFVREELKAGTVLYKSDSEAKGFYLVESGILRSDYDLEQGRLFESILAGTTCGELPFFSETNRTATVSAEVDSVVWKLDKEQWEKLKSEQSNGMEVANELLKVALKLTVERFTSVTAYVLISSS